MRNILKISLLSLTALGGLSSLSPAATVSPAPALGDLILGFEVASTGSGPGQSTNLEVDLGSASLFYNATPGATFTLGGLSLADLVGIYGSSWNTRTDLSWGVAGSTQLSSDAHSSAYTLWLSEEEVVPGVKSSPYVRETTTSQRAAGNSLSTLVTNSGQTTLLGATATANSSTAAAIDSTKSGSWTFQKGGSTFGYNTGGLFANTTNIAPGSFAISDLWELQPTPTNSNTPGTYLGYFALGSTGVLTFTAAPEPSSVALALVAGLGVLARRRRRV
jgi:hypothetical protein